jgi:SH3-like domain-containing protein
MKGKLHTWLAAAAGVVVIAGALGSMQGVYAARTEGKSLFWKKEANDDSAADSSGINKRIPVLELEIDKSFIQPELKVSSSGEKGTSGYIEKEEGVIAGIDYDKLVMANVLEAVNIREEPSEDSAILGKLYKDCGGEIIERIDGWTKLKTGEVTGYVNDEYLLFGPEAVDLAAAVENYTGTSTTSCLRVRTEPGEDSKVLGLLAEGDKIEVIGEQGDWVRAVYSDGTECYIAAQYVTLSSEIPYGESIESIQKREMKEKREMESASRKASAETPGNDQAKPQTSAPGVDPSSVDEARLLAALIQCEGGNEIHEGQVAIGDVVVNRLRTGRFGSSIYSVIYARGQFGPAGSGKVAQIYQAGPKATCMAAAVEAISGVSYVGNATSFRSVSSGHQGIVIGNHVFW